MRSRRLTGRTRAAGLLVLAGLVLAGCGGPRRGPETPAPAVVPAAPPRPAAPPDTGIVPLRLGLNIPAYQLEVYSGERLIRRYRVAVGDSSYPTPVGRFAISRVEWDPWWTPPPSEWAKGDTLMPPGPANPMGRVKLAFKYLYFIHGTPESQSLGRAASHGCIRLLNRDAVELATLVQRYGSPELPSQAIDSIAAHSGSGRTRRFDLARPVWFEVRYQVIEVRQDTLVLYPDPYGREHPWQPARMFEALVQAGYDLAQLDTARLKGFEPPASGRRVVPLGSLRAAVPAAPVPARAAVPRRRPD